LYLDKIQYMFFRIKYILIDMIQNTGGNMSKRVLLTYFESGMGHITSIQSISDSLKKYPDIDIVESRVMQEGNNPKMIGYENFIIKNTQLTNCLRGYGNACFNVLGAFGLRFFRLLHKTTFAGATKGVIEYFKSQRPDVIVSTHYYMTYCGLEYKKIAPEVQIVTYNPDNNVHMWWDNREGVFFVNNQSAYRQALRKHFDKDRVFQIPCTTRQCILDSKSDKIAYRKKFGLPQDNFTVIIADGAYAKAKADLIAGYLLNTDRQITIIFVAGKNRKLYDKYVALKRNLPDNIYLEVLPFTPNIHEYYSASDIFVCKGGPNAVLDSVYMHTPVLIDYYAHPIEKATIDYFVDELGCGKAIFSPAKIKKQIEQWIDDPSQLQSYIDNTYKIDKRDNGAERIAAYISNC